MGLAGLLFWAGQTVNALMVPNGTLALAHPEGTAVRPPSGLGVPRYHRKRHISAQDMSALLDYHNHIRASVYPPAANMEYMHEGTPLLLLKGYESDNTAETYRSLFWYRSVIDLVKPWSEEKQHYLFPVPRDCNPQCPWRCSGPVCSHYTQMVWASSNRLGCAIHTCSSIKVWGSTWHQAVYLVCNYAIKGNWIGEAPYKMGRPCSACPPRYQGSCSSNLCFPGLKSNRLLWF
ncbi:PREDICTED: peptidase inhibitor R3HDML [Galeopterus variegatus]|uniref:Peptidase inhibitor R3HDML n=1 Tax=Galeopterus variegatus TaxID=482537 RepID=A0ABM0REG1_GALVR|nr:PREDICTED: peptidase inhibitor R3HDML [Galeopterus variegatus]